MNRALLVALVIVATSSTQRLSGQALSRTALPGGSIAQLQVDAMRKQLMLGYAPGQSKRGLPQDSGRDYVLQHLFAMTQQTPAASERLPGVPLCPIPVSLADARQLEPMPVARIDSALVERMPVANSLCQNPLFAK